MWFLGTQWHARAVGEMEMTGIGLWEDALCMLVARASRAERAQVLRASECLSVPSSDRKWLKVWGGEKSLQWRWIQTSGENWRLVFRAWDLRCKDIKWGILFTKGCWGGAGLQLEGRRFFCRMVNSSSQTKAHRSITQAIRPVDRMSTQSKNWAEATTKSLGTGSVLRCQRLLQQTIIKKLLTLFQSKEKEPRDVGHHDPQGCFQVPCYYTPCAHLAVVRFFRKA